MKYQIVFVLWGFKLVIGAVIEKSFLYTVLQNAPLEEHNTFKFIFVFYFLHSLDLPSKTFIRAYRMIFIVRTPNIVIVFPVPRPIRTHDTTFSFISSGGQPP